MTLFTTKIKPWHYSLLRSNHDIIHYLDQTLTLFTKKIKH